MTDEDLGSEPQPDERLTAGLDHLQRAAREMIAASRALLDVAEELVEDPQAAAGMVDLLGSLAERGMSAVPGRGSADADDPDDDEPPVQRIPVS